MDGRIRQAGQHVSTPLLAAETAVFSGQAQARVPNGSDGFGATSSAYLLLTTISG